MRKDDYMEVVLRGGDFTEREETERDHNPNNTKNTNTNSNTNDVDPSPHAAPRLRAGAFEGLRYYTAGDVLAGWRAYDPHRQELNESGGIPLPASFTMSKPGERDDFAVDTRLLMYLHVEKFFAANIEWHAAKPFIYMGRDCEAVAIAFGSWYEAHPMMIALAQSERATMEVVEYVLYPLSEAVMRFNARYRGKVIYDSALKAAQKGRLNASRPEGRWHTSMADIATWQKVEKDRDKAA